MYIESLLLHPTPTSMLDVNTVTSCAVKHSTLTLQFAAETSSWFGRSRNNDGV